MKEIHLLHDHDHYDLITIMSGYHMVSYYCSACGNIYSNKERHNCDGICRMCYGFNEECSALTSNLARIGAGQLGTRNVLPSTNRLSTTEQPTTINASFVKIAVYLSAY